MRQSSRVLFVLLGLVGGVACRPAPLESTRFRSLQAQSAFERAVTAVETHCGGVHRAQPETGTIVSAWWDPDFGQGIPPSYIYVRWLVSVVPNPSDDSADIRVRPEAVLCGLLDSRDPDERAKDCSPLDQARGAVVPDSVYARHEEVVRSLREDVFRRE